MLSKSIKIHSVGSCRRAPCTARGMCMCLQRSTPGSSQEAVYPAWGCLRPKERCLQIHPEMLCVTAESCPVHSSFQPPVLLFLLLSFPLPHPSCLSPFSTPFLYFHWFSGIVCSFFFFLSSLKAMGIIPVLLLIHYFNKCALSTFSMQQYSYK